MLIAVLDSSAQTASFAVARAGDGEVLVELPAIPAGRASAVLFPQMLEALAQAKIPLAQIRAWTIGMGPGSFTGIRVGAALVQGICTGTGARCRGLPSSLALARQAAQPGDDRLIVLHDGRRSEVIVSVYQRQGPAWLAVSPAAAIPVAETVELTADRFAILRDDKVLPQLPKSVAAKTAVLDGVRARELLKPPGWPWPEDGHAGETAIEPVYVRPAVFVKPTIAGASIKKP